MEAMTYARNQWSRAWVKWSGLFVSDNNAAEYAKHPVACFGSTGLLSPPHGR